MRFLPKIDPLSDYDADPMEGATTMPLFPLGGANLPYRGEPKLLCTRPPSRMHELLLSVLFLFLFFQVLWHLGARLHSLKAS